MKIFAAAFFLASSCLSASAFSTVAPSSAGSALRMTDSPDPVDYSMRGIDAEGSYDPVEGDSPALIRNNNDGVWVEQVRAEHRCIREKPAFVGRWSLWSRVFSGAVVGCPVSHDECVVLFFLRFRFMLLCFALACSI